MTRPSDLTLRNTTLCRPSNSVSATVALFAYVEMQRLFGGITAVAKRMIAIQARLISDPHLDSQLDPQPLSGQYRQIPIPT